MANSGRRGGSSKEFTGRLAGFDMLKSASARSLSTAVSSTGTKISGMISPSRRRDGRGCKCEVAQEIEFWSAIQDT